jgi:hypothetical protein
MSVLNEKNDLFKDLIENKFNAIKDTLKENGVIQDDKRNGLVKYSKLFKLNAVNSLIVETYSSGAESDMEEEKLNEATVRDVYKAMWDYNTIMVIVTHILI